MLCFYVRVPFLYCKYRKIKHYAAHYVPVIFNSYKYKGYSLMFYCVYAHVAMNKSARQTQPLANMSKFGDVFRGFDQKNYKKKKQLIIKWIYTVQSSQHGYVNKKV